MRLLLSHHFLALLIFPLAAHGTVVTTTTDEDDGNLGGGNGVSLREAVKYSPATTTITFAPALSGQTIRLILGEILISQSLTIDGSALPVRITLSGDKSGNGKTSDDTTVFRVGPGTIVLDSLIISGGHNTGGGGIRSTDRATNLTVKKCQFTGNSARIVGGAIFFALESGTGTPTLTLQNSTFTGNSAVFDGGAIHATYPIQIQSCSFTGNSGGGGGAIFMRASTGPTSIFSDSVFSGNSAAAAGGAIYLGDGAIELARCTVDGNSALFNGGGVYCDGDALLLKSSTISRNFAKISGGGIFSYSGYNIFENSTIALNTANDYGGGIFFRNTMDAVNCTIAANTAKIAGGGLAEGSAYLRATIVSGNTAPSSPDVFLREVDTKGNLITPILSLAPLGSYGGPTQTMPPLTGSPAIDPVPDKSSLSTDQRGYYRDGLGDIGAVEYQGDRYEDSSIINRVMPQIWSTDVDGDGLPHAIEHLHGTNPFIPDHASPATLSVPVVNSAGHRVLTFTASQNTAIRDPDTHTFWYLMRSPDLRPGTWSEVYRFTPSAGYAKPGVTFTQVPDPAGGEKIRITVTDSNPLPGGAFYRFEAVLGVR
jgi:CSLREA domain-containing protein